MDYSQLSTPENQKKIQTLLNNCQDPVWFSENILGGSEPWEKQVEVMQSVRDNKYTAVKSGNGVGKTWTAGRIVLWFLTAYRPSRVITTAPTWQQVEKLLWSEVSTQFNSAKVPLGGKMLQTQLKITDEHFAIGYSTDDATRFQGHHSEHILIIFDEAMGVRSEIWEGAYSMMTNAHARFLAIGNPTAPVGPFYDCFRSPLWNKITISCFDCPNVKTGEVKYPRLVTKEFIEERRSEWGESSPEYKSRVLGEFPVEGEDTLIPLTWVEKAMERVIKSEEKTKKILGVDVAGPGDDKTAFIIMDGMQTVYTHGSNERDTMKTVGRIIQLVKDQKITIVAVDYTGIGIGVCDRLNELLQEVTQEFRREGILSDQESITLVRVNFGSSAQDSDRFDNLKAEMFWNLRLDFENNCIGLQKSDNLLEELPSLMYEITSKGKLRIVDKERMRKLGIHSPDYADALAIAHYASYAGRAGILDFYRSETEHHEQPKSIISAISSGSSLEEAFRELTR